MALLARFPPARTVGAVPVDGEDRGCFCSPGRRAPPGEPVTVATLLKNPGAYDQKRVHGAGLALIVRKNRDAQGQPWTLMSLSDIEQSKQVMNVFDQGIPPRPTVTVRVTGTFR